MQRDISGQLHAKLGWDSLLSTAASQTFIAEPPQKRNSEQISSGIRKCVDRGWLPTSQDIS
jgi:hypothetical protein